ncbi:hypothetical protein SAMN06265355_12860 [Actinomadura mexicana]|uniref:Superinfection immunity protein n=2 Tax=Actinomadura mexicana TaxID=134959 RepID=A0A239H5Q1_9ACTN|nr:hypothetical protein SAMN06265355_12860 [Actinomadura mexicana]
MIAIQSSAFFWLGLVGLLAFLAVLPTLIALIRGADDIGYIILSNLICCATVLAWPIAVFAAMRWPANHSRPPSTARKPGFRPPLGGSQSNLRGRGPNA